MASFGDLEHEGCQTCSWGLLGWPPGGKQPGSAPATTPGDPGGMAASTPSLAPIVCAAQGKVWIATESLGEIVRGQPVEVDGATDVQLGDHTGLVSRDGCWLKVELVDQGETDEFRKERHLYPSASDPVPSSVANAKADEEPTEDDGDARTLYVDYDEQGHRYKSWRKVIQEAIEGNFSHGPLADQTDGV